MLYRKCKNCLHDYPESQIDADGHCMQCAKGLIDHKNYWAHRTKMRNVKKEDRTPYPKTPKFPPRKGKITCFKGGIEIDTDVEPNAFSIASVQPRGWASSCRNCANKKTDEIVCHRPGCKMNVGNHDVPSAKSVEPVSKPEKTTPDVKLEEPKTWSVYEIIFSDGMRYCGIHNGTDWFKRVMEHFSMNGNPELHRRLNDMQSVNNRTYQIRPLACGLTEKEARELETKTIHSYGIQTLNKQNAQDQKLQTWLQCAIDIEKRNPKLAENIREFVRQVGEENRETNLVDRFKLDRSKIVYTP